MTDWYDKEQIECRNCGHRWILISNKDITDEQHILWFNKVLEQHAEIAEEEEE